MPKHVLALEVAVEGNAGQAIVNPRDARLDAQLLTLEACGRSFRRQALALDERALRGEVAQCDGHRNAVHLETRLEVHGRTPGPPIGLNVSLVHARTLATHW